MLAFLSNVNVNTPTAAGLTGADLIGILSIIVIVFGILLSAIGILFLRNITNLTKRMDRMEQSNQNNTNALWAELAAIRARLWGTVRIPRPDGATSEQRT